MALLPKDEFLSQLAPDATLEQCQDECPICHEIANNATQTACKHIFCLKGLKKWLATSHTCPSCRKELYEAPEEAAAEDENERAIIYADWPGFGFEFNETAVRDIAQGNGDVNLVHTNAVCSINFQTAYVDYDRLLAIAVAYMSLRVRDVQVGLDVTGLDAPACFARWTIVASAIEEVLKRNSGNKVEGLYLFLSMESEIERRFREHGLAAVSGEEPDMSGLEPHLMFEHGLDGVLRCILQAGYHFNIEQRALPPVTLGDEIPRYDYAPFFVHDCDLTLAHKYLSEFQPDPPYPESRKVYISSTLLRPTILAAVDRIKPARADVFNQDDDGDLREMYNHAWWLVPRVLFIGLAAYRGETTTIEWLYSLLGGCLETISREGSQLPWFRGDAFSPSKTGKVREALVEDGRTIMHSVVYAAATLHDELQLALRITSSDA